MNGKYRELGREIYGLFHGTVLRKTKMSEHVRFKTPVKHVAATPSSSV
jgi:hypothetical protein